MSWVSSNCELIEPEKIELLFSSSTKLFLPYFRLTEPAKSCISSKIFCVQLTRQPTATFHLRGPSRRASARVVLQSVQSSSSDSFVRARASRALRRGRSLTPDSAAVSSTCSCGRYGSSGCVASPRATDQWSTWPEARVTVKSRRGARYARYARCRSLQTQPRGFASALAFDEEQRGRARNSARRLLTRPDVEPFKRLIRGD